MYAKIDFGKCAQQRRPVTMIVESSDFIDSEGNRLETRKFEKDCNGHTHVMTVAKSKLDWKDSIEGL